MRKMQESTLKKYKLALVGKNISHSRSEDVYRHLIGQGLERYSRIDCGEAKEIPTLEEIFLTNDGLSITAPYKQHFLGDVYREDGISNLDAINCIRRKNSRFEGTNTDYLALCDLIPDYVERFSITKIVIFGSGAMAKVTRAVLQKMTGLFYEFIDRKSYQGKMSEINFSKDDENNLMIINACGREFEFRGRVFADLLFFDYNYDFRPHADYLSSQCHYIDGSELLKRQGQYALDFWGIPYS